MKVTGIKPFDWLLEESDRKWMADLEAMGPCFMVMPLESLAGRVVHMFGKQVFAADARTALLKARAEVLDGFLIETQRVADGWAVSKWTAEGWALPSFFSRDGNEVEAGETQKA